MSVKPTLPQQAPPTGRDAPKHTVFLVMDVPEALPMVANLVPRPSVVLARSNAVDHEILTRVNPDCILLPLMKPGFDIETALRHLAALGFRGMIWVLCPALPDRSMVEAELRAFAPGLQVHLIEIDG